VASSASNPCPETGKAVRDHILETLVSIVARKSTQQLTKSGLQCLDHFVSKRVVGLTEIALKYEEVEPSVASLPRLTLWRSFVFHLFSWMELTYVCPLAGKCLVHIFRGLDTAAQDDTASDSVGFTLEVWREWLQDALAQNPEILEDVKNYVLASIFKTNKDASLKLLEMFNRSQPLAAINHETTDQGVLLQLATLELGKKYGLVEEPSKQPDLPIGHDADMVHRQRRRHRPGFNNKDRLPPERPFRQTPCTPVSVCQIQRLFTVSLVPSNDEAIFRRCLQSAEETLGGIPCGL
jgi:hypothetical protein